MTPTATAAIVFAGAFGGVLAGFAIARVLPRGHITDASRDTVRAATAIVATMAALVLGFLVSSASSSLERTSDELLQIAGKVILLDRALANYGRATVDIRRTIKEIYATELGQLFSGDAAAQERLTTLAAIARTESIPAQLRALTPTTDAERLWQSDALSIAADVSAQRWLLLFQRWSTIPTALLVALIFWLTVIFASFGLFAPRNATVVTALFVCAVSASSAVFLIEEMNSPFTGWITISPDSLQQALSHLGE